LQRVLLRKLLATTETAPSRELFGGNGEWFPARTVGSPPGGAAQKQAVWSSGSAVCGARQRQVGSVRSIGSLQSGQARRANRSRPRGKPLGWVALTSRKARCRPSGKPLIGRPPTRGETASCKRFCRLGGLSSGRSGVHSGQCVPCGRGREHSQPTGLFSPLASGGDGASVASSRAGGWEHPLRMGEVRCGSRFLRKRVSQRPPPPGPIQAMQAGSAKRWRIAERFAAERRLKGDFGPLCGRDRMSRKAETPRV